MAANCSSMVQLWIFILFQWIKVLQLQHVVYVRNAKFSFHYFFNYNLNWVEHTILLCLRTASVFGKLNKQKQMVTSFETKYIIWRADVVPEAKTSRWVEARAPAPSPRPAKRTVKHMIDRIQIDHIRQLKAETQTLVYATIYSKRHNNTWTIDRIQINHTRRLKWDMNVDETQTLVYATIYYI